MLLPAPTTVPNAASNRAQRQTCLASRPVITAGHRVCSLRPSPQLLLLPSASAQQQQQQQPQTAASSAASQGPTSPEPTGTLEVTLRGLEALQTVRLGLVPQGQGQAVVVTQVAEGSRAEQLGVRRGQRLAALSDPLRYGTLWALQDRPSLRFVVDTLKMRRAAPIDLQFEPLLGQAEMDVFFGPEEATSSPSSGSAGSDEDSSPARDAGAAAAQRGNSGSADVDLSPDDALASTSSIDQLVGSSSGGQTIGERLAAQHAAQQRAQAAANQVQRRIDRRKAYMEIDEQRDDTGLLLGLAAAFLLPALVILAGAYWSGYLDRLYLSALTLR